MPFTFRVLLCLALVLIAMAGMAMAREPHWDYFADGNRSDWANHFKAYARLRLGPEQRLRNGVSWRMFTDLDTGAAMPRLTWMPSKQRLAAANRLLDMLQGSDMLDAVYHWHYAESENDHRRRTGAPLLTLKDVLEQRDIALTYVGPRFMSLMEAVFFHPSGVLGEWFQQGLTFDLESEKIVEVAACPGVKKPYGYSADDDPDAFLFQYGEWLQFCDRATYRQFIAVVREIADRFAHRLPPPKGTELDRCAPSPDRPLIDEKREYLLYLTFDGLAVQVSTKECPIGRTIDNPVIVPYRQLEPFLRPGPLRDELLSR
jgi:hypothetical protein